MNCKQANAIPLTRILDKMGCKPLDTHRGGQEIWYENPLREERTASFSVNVPMNVWKDFGSGEGGRVIDLVKDYARTDVAGALRWLERHVDATTLPGEGRRHSAGFKMEKKARFEIRQVKRLTTPGLNYYIHERGIKPSLAREYLQEARYFDNETKKEFYGLCLSNNSGGYAIRNKYMKLAIAPMDFTVLRGHNDASHAVHVFEGFFDFLTYLTITGRDTPGGHAIILNSTTMAGKAASFIGNNEAIGQGGARTHLVLWFDNEAPGSNAAGSVQRAIDHFAMLDYPVYTAQENYAGHKDLNAYWVATKERFDPKMTLVKKPDPEQVENPYDTGRNNGDTQLRMNL